MRSILILPLLLSGCLAMGRPGTGVLYIEEPEYTLDTETDPVSDTANAPIGVGDTSEDDDGDGWSEDFGDCDDSNPSVFPQVEDAIDPMGIDHNCDGVDGVDDDGDGWAVNAEGTFDCNDLDETVYPGAPEIPYNEVDDDCDALTRDDQAGLRSVDDDLDGYTENEGDCNDSTDLIRPDATEIAADDIDQNCDGMEACYIDFDGDYFGTITGETIEVEFYPAFGSCKSQTGVTAEGELFTSGEWYLVHVSVVATDCDDDNRGVFPGQGC